MMLGDTNLAREYDDEYRELDRARLARLLDRERARYADDHPRSREFFDSARETLLAGVPMSWMSIWSGGFPLYFDVGPRQPHHRRRRFTPTSTSVSATPAP